MSNAGNIKSPFNIFTSGGENDEVSCFLIMHSRAPEPRNSRLGAGIPPPGKAALLVPRFLPLFLPSLSPSTALTRSSSSTNLPFRHRVSTISTLIFFHFPFFFRFSRIYPFPAWRGEQVLSLLPSLLLDSSLSLVRRGDDYERGRSFLSLPRTSPWLVDFRASPFAFLPAPPPFSPSSIHPSLYPSGLCLFLK